MWPLRERGKTSKKRSPTDALSAGHRNPIGGHHNPLSVVDGSLQQDCGIRSNFTHLDHTYRRRRRKPLYQRIETHCVGRMHKYIYAPAAVQACNRPNNFRIAEMRREKQNTASRSFEVCKLSLIDTVDGIGLDTSDPAGELVKSRRGKCKEMPERQKQARFLRDVSGPPRSIEIVARSSSLFAAREEKKTGQPATSQ